jgi:hypothetical protein
MIAEIESPEHAAYSNDLSTITEISNSMYQSSTISPTNHLQSTKESESKNENHLKLLQFLKKLKKSPKNHQEKLRTLKLLNEEKLLKINSNRPVNFSANSHSPVMKPISSNIRRFSNKILRESEKSTKTKKISSTLLALMKKHPKPDLKLNKFISFPSYPDLRVERKNFGLMKFSLNKTQEKDESFEKELRSLTQILMNNQSTRVKSSMK